MTARENIEDFIIVIPFALTMFPVPLLFPVALVGMVIDQPEEWPVLAIYLTWLVIAIVLAILQDKSYCNETPPPPAPHQPPPVRVQRADGGELFDYKKGCMKTIEQIFQDGTSAYCSPTHAAKMYAGGDCPFSSVEMAIRDAMMEYAREQAIGFAFSMLKDYTGELFNPADNNLLAEHFDKFVKP